MAGLLKKLKIGLESKASDSISEVACCQEGIRKKKRPDLTMDRKVSGTAKLATQIVDFFPRPRPFDEYGRHYFLRLPS